MEELARAEPLAIECFNGRNDLLGPTHPATAATIGLLANICDSSGRPEKAAEYRTLLWKAEGADEASE